MLHAAPGVAMEASEAGLASEAAAHETDNAIDRGEQRRPVQRCARGDAVGVGWGGEKWKRQVRRREQLKRRVGGQLNMAVPTSWPN